MSDFISAIDSWDSIAQDFAKLFEYVMNTYEYVQRREKIAKAINLNVHPTVQQLIFTVFLEYCKVLTQERAWVDGRNEASAALAKKIMELTNGSTDLPFI